MEPSEWHVLRWLTLVGFGSVACCNNQAHTAQRQEARATDNVQCIAPLAVQSAQTKTQTRSSPHVQLHLEFPHFDGRDAPAIEDALRDMATMTLQRSESDWVKCQQSSQLGLTCPVWKMDTSCRSALNGAMLSVVCIHRLSDTGGGSPSISYDAINLVMCGNSIKHIEFERDVCSTKQCVERLHDVLVLRTGVRRGSIGSDLTEVGHSLRNFYLAEEHIVFLLGNSSLDNLPFDNRFVFGYNVVALPYADLVEAVPTTRRLLRAANLLAQ